MKFRDGEKGSGCKQKCREGEMKLGVVKRGISRIPNLCHPA